MSRCAHVPVRSCVGCGARTPQRELIRLSSTPDGRLQLVGGKCAVGRCGYLHADLKCWERFASRQGAVRSLRRKIDKATRMALVHELKQIESLGSLER